MDFATMNTNFGNDLKGFQNKLGEFIKKRKTSVSIFWVSIGVFMGISLSMYLSNELPIDSLTISLYAIVISLFIGFASLLVAWDSQKRGDFGKEYSELRFNYVMQYIKVVDDKLSELKKIIEDRCDPNTLE